ncbi:Asp-6 [Aphelenchoides besseyi]|nr:Asp-6 [Aphelenchoides besseyi]
MLIGGLLMATTLVVFVDAGSWKLPIREVKRVQRNNTLGPLNDIYREVLNFDRKYYRGSNILWIPKKGCKATGRNLVGNCESSKHVYDTKGSATAESLNVFFTVEYGGGSSTMKGQFFKDVFSFGENMRLEEKVTFGVVHEMNNEDRGILGLGNAIDPHQRGSSIIHEAWRQKVIDAPLFTIYLRKCPESEDCEKFGTITIGSHDKEMCGEIEGHVKVNPKNTGAPGIYVPIDIYKQLIRAIKATRTNEGDYVVRCDANVVITLLINGHTYFIPKNQLLINLHTGLCSLRVEPFAPSDGAWILGIPFLRYANFFVVEN